MRPEGPCCGDGAMMPLVLVIDDASEIREAVNIWLEPEGFRVAGARNGFEGLTKAVQLRPDLIVMDLSMPGMDGVETTRLLKRLEATRAIPVIAFTGAALIVDGERARRRGFAAVVTKSGDPMELVSEVQRVFDEKGPHADDEATS